MLSNHKVVLMPLTVKQAESFYQLYANKQVVKNHEEEVIYTDETSRTFTERIIAACNNIWTVRAAESPELIIGDCALHDYDPETRTIEIGGSLLPEYWGKGYMQSAFSLAIAFAQENYSVTTIVAKTTTTNNKAIRFAEKFGFHLSDDAIFYLKL